MTTRDRIAFVTATTPEAETARNALVRRYGDATPQEASVIVALGGDGLMLQTLHNFMDTGKPIYGMHRGTVGFLMNEYSEDNLRERLATASESIIHPLMMRAIDAEGAAHEARAINEVALFRQTSQAARLRVLIDGKERLSELMAEVRFVRRVETRLERSIAMRLLFDPGHALDERILREQFGV